MIEIYGKTQCPYCDMAKQLCQQEKLDYNYSQLDVDFTREQLFELFPGARTFPQIKIDGQSIYDSTIYSLRKNISLVGQDTTLFDDTIKNNIFCCFYYFVVRCL